MEGLGDVDVLAPGARLTLRAEGIAWHANDLGAWCYMEAYNHAANKFDEYPMVIRRHEFPAVAAVIATPLSLLTTAESLVLAGSRIGYMPGHNRLYVYRRETDSRYYMTSLSFQRLWEAVLHRPYPR